MALNLATSIKVTADVQGSQKFNLLARQLHELSTNSQVSGRSLDMLYSETRKLGSAAGNTISSLKGQASAMRTLRDEAEFGSRKFNILTRDIEAVEARLRRYQQTASQAGGLSKGGALIAGLAGGVAGAAAVMVAQQARNAAGGITQAGLDAESAAVRLKALTTEFGEYNQAQASAERIAKTLRISTTEATQGFADLYAALRPSGVTLKETEDAFIGFTAAARVGGATATEASAALLQLKQALGSGVLQGDELRSIREQAPLVGQAIAKEMGVTIDELKKLGSEGKITTDIVLKALATLKSQNLSKLNQQFDTGAQAIKDFQVAAENLGKTLSRVFGPTTVNLLREVTRSIQDMTDVIGSVTGNANASDRMSDKIRARDQAADETRKRFGISGLWRQGEQQSFFQQRQQQILDRLQEERLVRREQQAAREAASSDQLRARSSAAGARQAARARASGSQASSGSRMPDYIDKSVLRNWLMSQGFGRTSGDFTNAGHQTPNHMLNAMDMGILGGSDADALRKTAAMERALQATGAFGSQLFGPTRDPYGHGAGKGGQNIHLHIPTPGGKVKMTEGLAQLMGMDGNAASWKEFQQAEKQAADEAQRLQRTMQDQLLTSRERLAAAENNLRIAEAQTDEQKLQAEFDAERSDRITRYAALLRDSLSVEERANILKAQYREGLAAEMEFEKQISEARQKSYEATLLQIEAQREAMTQMGDALGGQVFGTPDIVAPGDQQFSPFAGYVEGIGSMNEALNGLATTGFKGIEDAMVSLATTGKANFREFAAALLEDTARLIIQQMVLKTILSAIGGGGGSFAGIPGFAPSTGNLMDGFSGFNPGAFSMPSLASAKGNVFARNGVVPFANGGIVNRPTLFPFARGGTFGTGVMGEAGPEAILPLKRGRDGRLGVAGGGGGDINISVQVDAGGTNAEGNADTGRQLANVVANAVKTEMIRQKRPGGILSK